MITEEAREQMEQAKARNRGHQFLHDGQEDGLVGRFGARTLGDMALVEPGCEVYARVDGDVADVRMRADGEARGGIVIEVTDTTIVDEDGAITQQRAFRCFDYQIPDLAKAFTVLTEAQVDPDGFEPPRIDRIRGLYRRLCQEVGAKRGTASAFEIDLVAVAARLAAIVGQKTH